MNERPQSGSLAFRALLVVALFFGFYALAWGLAAFCFWIPWAEHAYAGHVGLSGIACAFLGVYFVWATLPAWAPKTLDRPDPLAPNAHPRLRALIAEVAAKVGEPPPDVVYLLPEANAFTAHEGGFLGFGRKSVVGIGLPLLSTLTEEEVRVVLAHEFGHHKGGDLRVGPFVHRTRMALGRAIGRLDGSSFLLHWPFILYARFFLRVSREISRAQELAADALSAQTVNAEAAGSALRHVESLAPRWDAYFYGEVLPLVAGGYRPPMLDGFERFLAQTPWRADVQRLVRRAERRQPRDYDTHPPLEERLRALGVRERDPRVEEMKAKRSGKGPRKNALGLLDAPSAAEADALSTLLKKDAPPLVETGWDVAAAHAWLPLWRRSLEPSRGTLAAIAVRDIPAALDDAEGTWLRLHPGVISLLSPLGARRSVSNTLGVYLAVVCADAGFDVTVPLGQEIVAIKGEVRFEPEVLVRRLADGVIDEDEFLEVIERAELGDKKGFRPAAAKPAPRPAPVAAPPPADDEDDEEEGDDEDE